MSESISSIITDKGLIIEFVGRMPIGAVISFFGDPSLIPSNWHILDGSTVTMDGAAVVLPDTRGAFKIGADGSTLVCGATGGAASSTSTIGGTAITIAQMPPHNHGVSDPGHNHGISDPGHGHGVNDPGHGHGYSLPGPGTYPCASGGNYAWRANYNQGETTGGSGTGIWISGSGTGISFVGAYTGVTFQNNGGDQTHTHTCSSVSVLPPYVALYDIIRVS